MYIVVSNLGKKLKTLGKVLVFLLALGVLIPEQLPCTIITPRRFPPGCRRKARR